MDNIKFEQEYEVVKTEVGGNGTIGLELLSVHELGAEHKSRIACEARNLVKFSKGSKLSIGDMVKVTIEQTGRGFGQSILDAGGQVNG